MGFRFRRSIKLLPGVRLNVSTRGVSTSLGGRGATVNIGRKGARATVGIPGTGLSYSTGLFGRSRGVAQAQLPGATGPSSSSLAGWIGSVLLLLLIASCIAVMSSAARRPATSAPAVGSPALPQRTVAANGVNCRAAPVNGAVLATLDKGAKLPEVDQQGGWAKLARMGGDCWVSDALLMQSSVRFERSGEAGRKVERVSRLRSKQTEE